MCRRSKFFQYIPTICQMHARKTLKSVTHSRELAKGTWELRVNILRSSLSVLYHIYYRKCAGEPFDLTCRRLSRRTVRHKYHSPSGYIHSTTVRFPQNFLQRATQLWYGQPAAEFPGPYTFNKRVYLHLKCRQGTHSPSGVARG